MRCVDQQEQRGGVFRKGCGCACVAAVTGMSYQDVRVVRHNLYRQGLAQAGLPCNSPELGRLIRRCGAQSITCAFNNANWRVVLDPHELAIVAVDSEGGNYHWIVVFRRSLALTQDPGCAAQAEPSDGDPWLICDPKGGCVWSGRYLDLATPPPDRYEICPMAGPRTGHHIITSVKKEKGGKEKRR